MMNRSLLTIVEIVIYLKRCLQAQRPTFVLTEIESCVVRLKTRNPEITPFSYCNLKLIIQHAVYFNETLKI